MDPVLSVADLRDATEKLMKEKVQSSRMKMLNVMCCRASASSSDRRIIAKTLTTCWEERRNSGLELLEWRTCIIEAAEGPTRSAKDVPEIFVSYVELAVKGSQWGAQVFSRDLKESLQQRDRPLGGLRKAVMRLAATVFEGAAEVYSSGRFSLFEEPLAASLEGLILSTFELVKVVYTFTMGKPSQQSGDDESLKKRCQELLNLTYRLVQLFRRQIGSNLTPTSEDWQQKRSAESRRQILPTALRVVAASVNSFMELGKLSTSGGEVSFGLLNVSWKSITALLQVEEGREVVASAVDVPPIITTLISNAVQASKRAVEIWLVQSPHSEQKDPRRLFIPIKFFLMSALKISQFYPLKAVMASRNMVSCASKVFACLLQKDLLAHKAATEAFAELVVPTAFALLQNLLTEQCLDKDKIVQLLQDIVSDSDELESSQTIADLDGCHDGNDIVDELFGNKPAVCPAAGLLKTGRVVLFLSVLRVSCNYSTILLSELLRRLPWLLDEVPDEAIYVLMTQKLYLPGKASDMSGKWKWQLMFPWVSHTIKLFALEAAKHEAVWVEFKYFLFDHVLHPCVICGELIMDVWSFIIRHSDSKLAQDHIVSLLSLLQCLSSLKADVTLQRRLARVLCGLVQLAPDTVVERAYDAVFRSNPFGSPQGAGIVTMLVHEGFPFTQPGWVHLLSCCIASGKGLVDSIRLERRGVPSKLDSQKPALTCLLLLLSQSTSGGEYMEDKYLEEIKHIVHNLISMYTQKRDNALMFHTHGIIGLTLELIPHVQHILDPETLHALLPSLLDLCQFTKESSQSKETTQALAEFLANLSEIAIPEDENNPAMKALWGLYQLVLREKHWALVHMGLQSFAHFAGHTSCQELWRFVPLDAAVVSKGHADDDAFMTALKAFIEKECALTSLVTSEEELELLRRECNLQQQKLKFTLDLVGNKKDVDGGVGNIPLGSESMSGTAEIQEAVAMLCKGIGVLKERVPDLLHGETPPQWEVLRARLAEVNAQVDALQRRPG